MRPSTEAVLALLREERAKQHRRWGDVDHPDGTGPEWRDGADTARLNCEAASRLGLITWRHILVEEVMEALAENDPAALERELVQVGAVAARWVEALRARATT